MANNTVLVTGARGFLGRFVAQHYLQQGWRVTGIGRGSCGSGEPLPAGMQWHSGEVNLQTLVALDVRPDLIVHCAGSGSVANSLGDPLRDYGSTVCSTAAVLEFARQHCPSCVVVYPSSAAVYGDSTCDPVDESMPYLASAPASPYGTHKLMAEQLCISYARHFRLKVAIVRLFSLYGEGLRKQLLWDACCKIERGDHVYAGTGNERRDWMHAEDAARLLATVAAHATPACPIFNGASGRPTTVRQALLLLYGALGVQATPSFSHQARVGDPPCLQADMGRTHALGWAPAVDMELGIGRYARWFAQSRELAA
ncbi:NAD-dependent epimerase/dehydratase family protein [Cupriavidus respiraculi]|uniref:NAD-dependent epimerase/dehydratase family protein n=1 Tax=Cupriavidus respiraculi TaxID=195930 RepID=UPI001C9467D7|nr:NAD-dependent epimerase/dehydratase family protein [Cupriavidus respiraculi]MBY4947153.1 NAD-dependent epimerase/dehydratase family protein [Cupriavidus respiraculi]